MKGKGGLIAVLVILLVLGMALGGILVFSALQGGKREASKHTQEEETEASYEKKFEKLLDYSEKELIKEFDFEENGKRAYPDEEHQVFRFDEDGELAVVELSKASKKKYPDASLYGIKLKTAKDKVHTKTEKEGFTLTEEADGSEVYEKDDCRLTVQYDEDDKVEKLTWKRTVGTENEEAAKEASETSEAAEIQQAQPSDQASDAVAETVEEVEKDAEEAAAAAAAATQTQAPAQALPALQYGSYRLDNALGNTQTDAIIDASGTAGTLYLSYIDYDTYDMKDYTFDLRENPAEGVYDCYQNGSDAGVDLQMSGNGFTLRCANSSSLYGELSSMTGHYSLMTAEENYEQT